MRLDRNVNPDGRGKYALINLRTNKVEWGNETQFFVIKYSDEFAFAALKAYSEAVLKKAIELAKTNGELAASLKEFSYEMFVEAHQAGNWPVKKLPD